MSVSSENWGPWIDHDGKGFPVPIGTLVHMAFDAPIDRIKGEEVLPRSELICTLEAEALESWLWALPRYHPIGQIARVIRYRVHQPRALQQLRRIAAEPQPIEVDA